MEIGQIIISIIEIGFTCGFFLFIMWDHFKENRLLRMNVKNFYLNIENIIWTYYEKDYYEKYKTIVGINDLEQINERISKLSTELKFYNKILERDFSAYSKYLGLVLMYDSNIEYQKSNKIKVFLTKSEFSLRSEGFISNFIESVDMSNVIEPIRVFLKALRDYWNENFSLILLRCKIKERRDFYNIVAYQKPIKRIKQDDGNYNFILKIEKV